MMRLRFGSIICLMVLSLLVPLHAQDVSCAGPSQRPEAGDSGPFCVNGRMGYAATAFAWISQAPNIPPHRAADIARREAELKARAALAKFLNTSGLSGSESFAEGTTESSEGAEWQRSYNDTLGQNFDARLPPGIAVVAVKTHDGAVYVTVATWPDTQDLADSINRRFSK